ncbi:MAG: hypothetical protein J6C85_08270 [Alphaproteobacteria bacterium]|nr:hypothetical protein [Alphaproteobacteria bacterium]
MNMKYLRLFTLTLLFTCVFTAASYAAGIMDLAAGKAVKVFNHVKMIIFIVGGFGLVGIAFQAIFGKVKWTWFAGLAVGLAILAAASAIINYATGANVKGNNLSLNDTFGNNDEGAVDDGSGSGL